jgi:hypothetical protein
MTTKKNVTSIIDRRKNEESIKSNQRNNNIFIPDPLVAKPRTTYSASNLDVVSDNLQDKPDHSRNFSISPLARKFLVDWEKCRDRHPGQAEVLKAIFQDEAQYTFYRAGRKGAKTTTAIDVVWRVANTRPNSVLYLCYPTIAQGIEVVWEERRLQTCDQKNDWMYDMYVEKVDDSRHIVRFSNGSFVKLIGTWTEARGRGTQPDFLVYDEIQDCSPEYIDAMDSNLAAKEHARCLMMGTPPKKRNHYEDWLKRVEAHPRGRVFHYTSYDNIRLPHLKQWLDNKKQELIKAGKEDIWQREYMAELCYSSSDRILPDAKFIENLDLDQKLREFPYSERIPVLGVSITPNYFCAILAVLCKNKSIFIIDHLVVNQVWNQAFSEMYPLLNEKVKALQDLCGKKIRNIVWDESESFLDVVTNFSPCRKDIKWQDRGIPLLREMMVKNKIILSRDIADFGMECQNMLLEEPKKDIQKNYPHVCTLSMLVNEYFSQERIAIHSAKPYDHYEELRKAGIPCQPPVKKRNSISFAR